MAQPTNTVDTYDIKGIREDLSNVIYNLAPDETPMLSALPKEGAANTLHEWQTDALRASQVNAHIEGDNTVADPRTTTVRLGNYTQIFKNAIVVSGTEKAVTKAGRATEMAYESMKMAKEHKLDMELAIFANQAKVAGSSAAARRMAGMGAWVKTNVVNIGTGGANPAGDGSNARTDGTQTPMTQADFNAALQLRWTNGGRSPVVKVFLSPYQLNVAADFVGNNNQQNTVKKGEVADYIDVYQTNWGRVEWVPSLENRARDVWIVDPKMWGWATLRGTKNEPLAKTGDNEMRQLVTEATLVCRNEKASALVADASTS